MHGARGIESARGDQRESIRKVAWLAELVRLVDQESLTRNDLL